MPNPTTNYGLLKPVVNDAVDQNLWGGQLNGDMDELDSLILTAVNFIKSSQTSTFSIVAPTTGTGTTGDSHKLFRCDATSGNIIANLPSATSAGNGFTVALKKIDGSGNTITVTANGSDEIDGAGTFVLNSQYNWAILVCDGTASWDILSDTSSTAGLAPINSPAFTGTPTAPTPSAADSTTRLATTSFVNGTALTLASGTTATTQTSTDSSTKVATTAFVQSALGAVTPLGIGSIIMARYTVSSTLAAGATTAAANLTPLYASSAPTSGANWQTSSSGDSITGTWQALQTVNSSSGTSGGLFQRIS